MNSDEVHKSVIPGKPQPISPSVLLFLFTSLLLSFPLSAYGPHTALDCLGCHDPHYARAQKIFKVKNEVMVNPRTGSKIDGVSALCLGCHNIPTYGGAGVKPIHLHMTHPVNVLPNSKIANVPESLLRNEMIQCISCHDPHPSNPNWRYLRVDTDGGTKVGRFCESCHPAKSDNQFYNSSRAELKTFTSMNEQMGAKSVSPWDDCFTASNPTPEYIQPLGNYPNSIAPAYPTVATQPWIYFPPEKNIPEQLKKSRDGVPFEPEQHQLMQQRFNQGIYSEVQPGTSPCSATPAPDQTNRKIDPINEELTDTKTVKSPKESPAPTEKKEESFGLEEDSLSKLGNAGYLEQMYSGIHRDFERSGVQLVRIEDGVKSEGLMLKKVYHQEEKKRILRALLFRIDGNMSFESGSSELTPLAIELIGRVSRAMKAYPETSATVHGHTDSTGSRRFNDALSLARAKSVAGQLIRAHELNKNRITEAKGFADRQKIVDTTKAEPANRRVDITVTPVEIKNIPVP